MLLDRTIPPEVKELSSFKITKAVSGTLSNGIPIHYIRSGNQDIVKIEIVYNAGNYYETKPALAFMTTKMLNEGTTYHSAKEIANIIATYGSFLELSPGNDKISISLTVLNKHLPFLLPLLREIIHDSSYPDENFENIKYINTQHLKINHEKTSFVATGLFKKNIFGENHPYGYFIDEKILSEVSHADCVSYYNSKIRENSFEIIVAGMVTDAVIKEIDVTLGKDKTKFPSLVSIKKEARGTGKYKIAQEKTDSVQCSLRIGRKLFTRNHPDQIKFSVLNEILGGYFGSRLMKNIREDKGLTYGIHSHVANLINEGYFVIGTDVKKELVGKALEEIHKEIETLKLEPVGDEELITAKNYMIGGYLGSINSPFNLAEKFKAIHYNGISYDFYNNYIENIKKVTSKDIIQLANKYFDKGNLIEVVVG